MLTVKNDKIKTTAAAKIRRGDSEGETFCVAEMHGVCCRWYTFHCWNDNKVVAWLEPTDGPVEWLRKIKEFRSIEVTYTENDEYPAAFRTITDAILADVVEQIENC